MGRKLFCELCPAAYQISKLKCQSIRYITDALSKQKFAKEKSSEILPYVIYKHNSLIRRKLGNVDMNLQENKAVNLSITAPKVNQILIHPKEVFSFWKLVGSPTKRKGYKEGLTISCGNTTSGIGGGMCQFTNLIHWMVLHTGMDIVEHHHHDGYDLFPDFNRKIPFGTGTSIVFNYLDYRFINNTNRTYQILTYVTDEYLCGEIRADGKQYHTYHVKARNEHFVNEDGVIYRVGEVYRSTIESNSGECISEQLIRKNHAKVMYDTKNLIIK